MNENKLEVYSNVEFGAVRTLKIEGKPYFVGKDVAEALGYNNTRKAIADHVDEKDKIIVDIYKYRPNYNPYSKATPQPSVLIIKSPTVFINESGLYSLVLSSKLPTTKKFKHWMIAVVLPAIKKHSSYNADYSGLSPQLQYLIALEQKTKELENRLTELEKTFERNDLHD